MVLLLPFFGMGQKDRPLISAVPLSLWNGTKGPSPCICPFVSLQFRKDHNEHGDKTGKSADDVGNRLGSEYACSSHMEGVGQQIGQRNDNEGLAQQGEKDGVVLFPQGFENNL